MRISRRELGSCVLIGALLPGANAVLFFAERDMPTGLASLIIASVPLWVVAAAAARPRAAARPALAGVGVGFVGVAVLAGPRAARPARGRPVHALGGDVGARLGAVGAADDAGRPVRGDGVRDARAAGC